jgi:hypothetical protein
MSTVWGAQGGAVSAFTTSCSDQAACGVGTTLAVRTIGCQAAWCHRMLRHRLCCCQPRTRWTRLGRPDLRECLLPQLKPTKQAAASSMVKQGGILIILVVHVPRLWLGKLLPHWRRVRAQGTSSLNCDSQAYHQPTKFQRNVIKLDDFGMLVTSRIFGVAPGGTKTTAREQNARVRQVAPSVPVSRAGKT